MAADIQITLVLRPPEAAKGIAEKLLAGTYDASQTGAADLEANAADVKAVTAFASSHNLQLVSVEPEKRTVRVAGSIDDIEKAFEITSGKADQGSVQTRDYKGAIHLPPPLDKIITAVLGLDQSPIAHHHGNA